MLFVITIVSVCFFFYGYGAHLSLPVLTHSFHTRLPSDLLGADIIMVLDECAEPQDKAYNIQALARTHALAQRCLAARTRSDQAMFGIVQGGVFQIGRARV